MSEKSILENALLQVQNLEEAVKANAKGILASTMKQELNELLKESMEEEEVEEQEFPDEETADEIPGETDEQEGLDNDTEEPEGESEDDEETEEDSDFEDEGDEPEFDETDVEGEFGSDDELEDDDMVDMTGASEEEVLKVFKAMGPDDGIVVKKDGDDVELSDGEDEYIIKLDDEVESEEPDFEDEGEEPEFGDEEDFTGEFSEEESEEDDVVYEIDLGEEDEEVSEEEVSEEDESHEEEVDEAARTKWNAHGDKGGSNRTGIKSKKIFKAGALNEEVKALKKQNSEYKKALILFKEKLNEVAVFNANLTYSTRLFTEHTTTKKEKLSILKRFDSTSTLSESESLYKTIKSELGEKAPISESVVEKITNAPSSSSSNVLSESKAYENPQFKRMKDLMQKIK